MILRPRNSPPMMRRLPTAITYDSSLRDVVVLGHAPPLVPVKGQNGVDQNGVDLIASPQRELNAAPLRGADLHGDALRVNRNLGCRSDDLHHPWVCHRWVYPHRLWMQTWQALPDACLDSLYARRYRRGHPVLRRLADLRGGLRTLDD